MRYLCLALASLLLAASAAACADPIPEAPPDWLSRPLESEPKPAGDVLRSIMAEEAEITVEGSTVRYIGVINGRSAYNFLESVRGAEDQLDTLIINSPGGETRSARRIGRWIHEHGVTVVVEELCFSSCANYIFTAAPKKIIRDGAYVGWHGSEQQERYITVTLGPSGGIDSFDAKCNTEEQIANPDQPPLTVDGRTVTLIGFDTTHEEEFLDQIGVSADALLYGLMPGQCEHYLTAEVAGWTFSIADMAEFGIRNVTYQGDHEYPGPHRPDLPPIIFYDLSGAPHRLFGAQPADR